MTQIPEPPETMIPLRAITRRLKELLMVEAMFRQAKSLLETRPIFHKGDDTIHGHAFCSFLSLVLLKELQDRLAEHGFRDVEWQRLRDDLNDLQEFHLELNDKHFRVRTAPTGDAGKALKAIGVA